MVKRTVFVVSGTQANWEIGRSKGMWGFSRAGRSWNECRAALQDCGFGSASEIVACLGPKAVFRALVDGDLRYDDTPVWPYPGRSRELYPVRFDFTKITPIGANWFGRPDVPGAWKAVLNDVYFKIGSLFILRDGYEGNPNVRAEMLFGRPASTKPLPSSPLLPVMGTEELDYRKKYPAEYRSECSHDVRSRAELVICNWLYHHHVTHSYERKVPVAENLLCDFYIPDGDLYVEYWGRDEESYRKKRERKTSIYNANGLKLIELQDADLRRLDDVLPRKLLKYGVRIR